ncbi:MAG: hypothetical protein IKP28_02410 [Clostridia bacterium]|nr:hypothetical protein [Clostridia bacterium]
MFTKLRLSIGKFIRENKWKVIVALIVWAVLIAISTVLTNMKVEMPITTYTPFEPIIENGETMPSKWQKTIENMIDEYIEYCNKKEYEKAYDMISESCKEEVYPTLDNFKSYVDYVFSKKRLYSIQNYSNHDGIYIFRIRIFENIMETGLTFSEDFKYFEEKFTFKEDGGKLLMGIKGFIGEEKVSGLYEDKYIKITVENNNVTYEQESYTIRIQNKTEHIIVLADSQTTDNEIQLETENDIINRTFKDNKVENIYLNAKESNTFTITFNKFYDEGVKATGIIFNQIKILRSYSGQGEATDEELEGAVDLYSITMPIQ